MKQSVGKRWAAMLLLIVVVWSFAGCGVSVRTDSAETQQADFDQFTTELARSELSSSILNLHYLLEYPENYGITEYEVTLGDYSVASEQERKAEIQEVLQELSAFDQSVLTEEQQFTDEILQTYLKDSLQLVPYGYYENVLSSYDGIQCELLLVLPGYRLEREKDVQDYIGILNSIPNLLASAAEYAKEQSKRGLFMSDTELQKTLNQCQSFIDSPDFLQSDFESRLEEMEGLTAEQKQSYLAEHQSVLKNQVVPAYQTLITELSQLKGTGKNDGGLANFPNGSSYYEALVQLKTGSDRSISEMKTMIQTKMDQNLAQIREILQQKPELYDKFMANPVDLSNPEQVLAQLQQAMQSDFTLNQTYSYQVKEIPAALKEYTSVAYYLTPQLDVLNENLIYINSSARSDSLEDYILLAHEGFPGHLYQINQIHEANLPLLRYVLDFTGYMEGWGNYAEFYGIDLLEDSVMEPDLKTLNRAYMEYIFGLYSMVDIGVNYDGWTEAETEAYLTNYGLDSYYAKELRESAIGSPAETVTYHVGYLEFQSLRETAEVILQENFSAKEYHSYLLQLGPAQFSLLQEKIKAWAETEAKKKANAAA